MAAGGANLSSKDTLTSWLGTSRDKNPRVLDASGSDARLNEPNGCWARTSADGTTFRGLYIADTGNDCIRFAHPDGRVETLELHGIPDVRSTASDCVTGVCYNDNEERKE